LKKILLTGATGQIGYFLLQRLTHEHVITTAVSRKPQRALFGEQWMLCDLSKNDPFDQINTMDIWIHAGLLTLCVPWLAAAAQAGVKRVVTFSTTSIFTKLNSSSQAESALIERIRQAEIDVAKRCEQLGMNWTILRPTMIYGRGADQNITFITNMINRFGFFPLVGRGDALRQPVHADDLAKAAWDVVTSIKSFNHAYNVSGGEILSYKDMVKRVFEKQGKPARIISLPPTLYKGMIILIRHTMPRYAFVQTSMIDRMTMDMLFDHADATADFNYHPRSFDCDLKLGKQP